MRVGAQIRTVLENSWLWAGTEWEGKMSSVRTGTIEAVPWAAREYGRGTIQVRWHSLTGSPNTDDANWLMWVHSDLVEVLE